MSGGNGTQYKPLVKKSSFLRSSPNNITGMLTDHLLQSQGILTHRLPAVLVAAGLLLEEEALREPEGTVLSLSTSNQHAYQEDDQKEKRSDPHQHQLAPLRNWRWKYIFFTCGKDKVGIKHLNLIQFYSYR